MSAAPIPPNEQGRLEALYALRLLDTPRDERFDAVTRLAAKIFEVPIAFVSLIDRERQWFKAKVGFDLCESSREYSFCAHAILQDEPLVVPDTLLDPRFAKSPFVTRAPSLRFYAGEPLRAAGGEKVGTLCIADTKPREFSAADVEVLRTLGEMLERELRTSDLIDAQSELLTVQKELLSMQQRLQEELRAAAEYVGSQLPKPLKEPVAIDWKFVPSQDVGGDGLGYHALDEQRFAFFLLDVCGHGVAPALMSNSLLGLLRSHSLAGVDFGDPAAVLSALNQEFPMDRHGGRFFTIWYGVLDVRSGRLIYASGGHPPALLLKETGGLKRLDGDGIAIGCVATASYNSLKERLHPGDVLYLVSDGAFELKRGDSTFDQLEERIRRHGADPESLDAIIDELTEAVGGSGFHDDVTIMRVSLRT